MPQFSQYVVPSESVKIYMTIPSLGTVPIETMATLSRVFSQNVEDIFAIGQKDPISIEALNATYTANFSLQAGEYNTILDMINAVAAQLGAPNGFASLLQVPPISFTYVYNLTRAAVPKSASTTLQNCRFDTDNADIDRNSSETLVQASLRGTGIIRTVSPIPIA